MGDMAHAMADFNAALASDPNFALALYWRGTLRKQQGDAAAGDADLAAAAKLDPSLATQ